MADPESIPEPPMIPKVNFISGHLDLTQAEFNEHYKPQIDAAMIRCEAFIIGDAKGADSLAQAYLHDRGWKAIVYHMLDWPRNNFGFATCGGFQSDRERDEAMTAASHHDIAWVRPGREKSGTARNLRRRST